MRGVTARNLPLLTGVVTSAYMIASRILWIQLRDGYLHHGKEGFFWLGLRSWGLIEELLPFLGFTWISGLLNLIIPILIILGIGGLVALLTFLLIKTYKKLHP